MRPTTSLALFATTLLSASPALAEVHRPPISGEAFRSADAAYRDFAARRFPQAAGEAARAVRLRPDIPRLRLLLVRSLAAGGRAADARAAAARAVRDGKAGPELRRVAAGVTAAPPRTAAAPPAAPPPPAPAAGTAEARRAYDALARGEAPAAVAAASEAVRRAPAVAGYRALLVDALTRAGRVEEAHAAAAAGLASLGRSAELESRDAYLLLRLRRYDEAAAQFDAALRRTSEPEERRRLSLALADARFGAGAPQGALDALAPYQAETGYEVASRRAVALIALQKRAEALEPVRAARRGAPGEDDRRRFALAELYLLTDLNRTAEAQALLRQVSGDPLFGAGSEVEVGELAVRDGDDALALRFFERARAAGTLTGRPRLDAAYAAKRQVRNGLAVALFEAALKADDETDHAFTKSYRYGLGREATDIARTWGVNGSILAGAVNFPSAVNGAPSGSDQRVTQAGGEVYWRPPVIGYRDGRTVELFARAFATLEDQSGGATGADSVQGYLGGRWKPISSQNLVLEVSRLVKLGSASRNDWLLRAAYSQEHGLDLADARAVRPMWRVYGELDRLTETPQTLAFADGRAGWSVRLDRLSDRLILSPLVDAAYSYDNRAITESALGVGPGIALRWFFGGGRFRAPVSYVELTAGERFRVFGARRADGPFATLSLIY